MQTPVGLSPERSMPRLTAIVALLCLLLVLSGVEAQRCGPRRNNECVPHHLCQIGFENGGPVVDLRKVQRGNDGCESTKKCCPADRIESNDNDWDNEPEVDDCGQVNANGLTFTIRDPNGLSQENELPWMTAVLHKNGTYMGGGSLIALDVVLTAHHVVGDVDSDEILVRAGEWDFATESERLAHVNVAVRKIVLHHSFIRRSGANNLALLFLEKPFKTSRHIRPICLPARNQNFDRTRCFVSGWGKASMEQNSFTNIMKKVDLPVVSFQTCQMQLRRHYGQHFQLHNSMMCAGGERGKDACKGDGGSPLACPLRSDPHRFEQAGIVNWGFGCGEENTPGVYTDVAKFRGWIDEQIKLHSDSGEEVLVIEDNEPLPGGEGVAVFNPTNPPIRNRPTQPSRRPPPRTTTPSPDEVNADDFFTIATTLRYQEPEEEPMKIIRT